MRQPFLNVEATFNIMSLQTVNPVPGAATNGSMDRVKKLISPGTRKKTLVANPNKTFSVPLDELVRRSDNNIPTIVQKICEYIEQNGFDQEGIFRVNGNARVVEKLKTLFDQDGDADLDEDGDIMAVAGILKLFLRELPDSVIPESMTQQFVTVQETFSYNPPECLKQLKEMLKSLPEEHYDLLKYLTKFLVIVTKHEKINKMSPTALAIVFGPNLFRCSQGIGGLKDQGTTNQIVYKFISNYDVLFQSEGEDYPDTILQNKRPKTPPPRPPPPKLNLEAEIRPVPSPRKSKLQNYDSSQYEDKISTAWDNIEDSTEPNNNGITPGRACFASPRSVEDEYTDRASPFIFDSDTSTFSVIDSPAIPVGASEVVEKTVSLTIAELMFGDSERTNSTSIDDSVKDVDGPNIFTDKSEEIEDNSKASDVFSSTGMESSNKMESDDMKEDAMVSPTRPVIKPKPAFLQNSEMENSQTKSYQNDYKKSETNLKYGFFVNNQAVQVEDMQTDYLGAENKENEDKTPKPAKRTDIPNPNTGIHLKQTCNSDIRNKDVDADLQQLLDETADIVYNGYFGQNGSKSTDAMSDSHKSRIGFLDFPLPHHNHGKMDPSPSPEKSPSGGRKPFVPPLDLSILHEHVDGSDPILAQKGQSFAYQRVKYNVQEEAKDENVVEVSPRFSKLNKKTTISSNTDVPPSPIVEQDQYKKHSTVPADDECGQKMRQCMKKIQVLKKRLKQYEEDFENAYGYKPAHSDKVAKPEVKKYLTELSKTKKELKRLKEEAEMGSRSRHGSGASSSGERTDPPDVALSIELTLETILKRLQEKRRESKRPENMEVMRRDEVQDEKLAVQKALLYFESIHGRPKNKAEKDIMRPLYDRYRTIKRILSKPQSPRDKGELETVPEEQPFELATISTSASKTVKDPIRIPAVEYDDEDSNNDIGTVEFAAVTRDFNILKDTVHPLSHESRTGHAPKLKNIINEVSEHYRPFESNLHELTVPELHDESIRCQTQKKRLRKYLRDFEDEFFNQYGRKVEKEDRAPMQTQYHEYKQVKARLKLLEALLSKHQHTML